MATEEAPEELEAAAGQQGAAKERQRSGGALGTRSAADPKDG